MRKYGNREMGPYERIIMGPSTSHNYASTLRIIMRAPTYIIMPPSHDVNK